MIDLGITSVDGAGVLMSAEYYFDKWLKEKREARGWTQPQLAEKAGTTKQTINAIERQTPHSVTGAPYRPSRKTVDKLAKTLKEPLADARTAAGFASPLEDTKDFERSRFARLYFKHMKVLPGRRKEFERVLEMVERDYDRELLDKDDKN